MIKQNRVLTTLRNSVDDYSLVLLIVTAMVAFLLCDVQHVFSVERYVGINNFVYHPPLSFTLVSLELFLLIQLFLAWRREPTWSNWQGMVLVMILLIRLSYRAAFFAPWLWGLRTAWVHTLPIGFLFYALGVVALHPTVYRMMLCCGDWIASRTIRLQVVLVLGFLATLYFVLSGWPSAHITRDGFDWIERTASESSVWHLYMREPLTIGLYRFAFNIAWPLFEWPSAKVIVMLSTLAGVWWFAWFILWLKERFSSINQAIISIFFASASGGMMVLFFGHIEVYPIFIASVMPAIYFAQRYLNGKGGIIPAAICISIAFLFHLSAAWVIPAFMILPFLKHDAALWKKETFHCMVSMAFVQVIFWGALIIFCYDASMQSWLDRLNVTFNVGPDRAMFLPRWLWFDFLRLIDLANEYLYLSLPCLVLLIPTLALCIKERRSDLVFWGMMALGFAAYSFFWNPDRNFPEDWDLFSALPFFVMLLQVNLFLSTKENTPIDLNNETKPSLLYLAGIGCLPFALAQIWFHYLVAFVR